MKKKWIKRMLALGAAAMMLVGSMTVAAAELSAKAKITPADTEYYKELIGQDAPETATITINKYVQNNDGTSADTNKPIQGVKFGIKKVGHIAQVQNGSSTVMAYGIENALAEELEGITWDYTDNTHQYVKNYKVINEALQSMTSHELDEYTDLKEEETGDNGKVSFTGQEYGLYLVVETDVSNAMVNGKSITITKTQYPYVVSAPVYTPGVTESDAGTWSADVNATAKNETGTAGSEKKIIQGVEAIPADDNNLSLVDNDNTHVGDTVVFRLTNDIIDLTDSKDDAEVRIDKYIVQDSLSKGFDFTNKEANIKITDSNNDTYVYGTDYEVAVNPTEDAKDSSTIFTKAYTDETRIAIKFSVQGLTKLTDAAKSESDTDKKLYVDYTVKVNGKAVVGEDGNPNKSRLIFAANGSHEITTDWDEVKEYIFTMEGNKVFDEKADGEKAKSVVFALYTDEACTTSANVTEVTKGTQGAYYYGGTSNEIKLDTDSKFTIKGVPADGNTTLYLKETETADGYNLLEKPVVIKLTAFTKEDGSAADEWGTLTSGTVNDNNAVNTDKAGVKFTVNNTAGFRLPSTGGAGAAIFAVIGILIIAVGGGFYLATSKKRR